MARTQAERTEATRAAFVAAGRLRFGRDGFAATSIEDLAREAGATRGALYHHFESKKALFRAVFEQLEGELMATVAKKAAGAGDAWARLHAGCLAFLQACRAPDVERIVLLDAPAVLGWEAWREVDERYALALLRGGIEAAMAEGQLRRRSAEALSHLVLGALTEAAMLLARTPRRSPLREQVETEIDTLLESFR